MNHLQGLGLAQDVYSSQDVAATTAAKGTQAASASASLAAAFAGDKAQLSTASTQISPAGDGDVRMEKVLALQSQIAAGTYNVSASEVADKVIGALLK